MGIRVPADAVAQALIAELGEPLVTTTLQLPGDDEPATFGWEIKERLDSSIDAVLDAGERGIEQTTVVDLSGAEPVVLRHGAGDAGRFE